MRRRWVGAVLAGVLSLSACSGVPSSSGPQVVQTVNRSSQPTPTATVRPAPGDQPRDIVSKFLQAQVTNDQSHLAAKAFLVPATADRWQDATTIVVGDIRVGYPNRTGTVEVSAKPIGAVDANGVYTPSLDNVNAPPKQYSFTLVQTGGQWRIAGLENGLIVSESDFRNSYHRLPLYFFDQSETRLVPDVRYTALAGQSLASWILRELLAGPQQQQLGALRDEFPDSLDPQRAKITLGDRVVVALPGIGQSDAATVNRIAAQLAYSLQSADSVAPVAIQDGTTTISLANGRTDFSPTYFPQYDPIPSAPTELYYLRDGALMNSSATAVVGKGANQYDLESVAVAGAVGSDLRLAGLTADSRSVLLVGSLSAGLRPVPLGRVATTRPDWVAADPDKGAGEVWVGVGGALLRVIGTTRLPVSFTGAGTSLAGKTITAVRVSPEGARVAMVLADASGGGAVYVGSVVRSDRSVSVEGLQQVTPTGWLVTDVSWAQDGQYLRAIGLLTSGAQIETWLLGCDGSLPVDRSTENLPGRPDAVTSTNDGSTWVSVSGNLWREALGWVDPFVDPVSQRGTAPTYAVP